MSHSGEYSWRSWLPLKTGSDSSEMMREMHLATEENSRHSGGDGKIGFGDHNSDGSNVPVEVDFYHVQSILDAARLDKAQVDSLKKAYNLVTNRNKEQQREISKLQKQIRSFEEDKRKSKVARAELDKGISSHREENITLKEKLGTAERQLSETQEAQKTVQDRLAKSEEDMTRCIAQRDVWKHNYEAELAAKREAMRSKNQLQVRNSNLGSSRSDYRRKFEEASSQLSDLQAQNLDFEHQCEDLENQVERVTLEYHNREKEYVERVKPLIARNNDMAAEIETLRSQCNDLAKQSVLPRTYMPLEDEAEVTKKFRQLNRAVKNWGLDAWGLRTHKAEVKISDFPLTTRQCGHSVTTDDEWLLLACVWEWLFRRVFGWPQSSHNVPDLWTDKQTISHLSVLEERIGELQKPDVTREWTAFTVQCLHKEASEGDVEGVELFVRDVCSWLLPMLGRSEPLNGDIERLMLKFKDEVVLPAVSFSALLRKKFTPVNLFLPFTIENAVSEWERNYAEGQESSPPLEIVVSPELRKRISCATPTSAARYEILFNCYKHSITLAAGHIGMQTSYSAKG